MELLQIKKAGTHDGTFHADEVFSGAILLLANPSILIIRTRDEVLLAQCDIRFDVGGKHSPQSGDFDHHMIGGAGKRANGVPYSSCGLIWKKYGSTIAGSDYVHEHVDRSIIQTVDAIDCGYSFGEEKLAHQHFTISDAVDAFNPAWIDEDQDVDAAYSRALAFAQTIIKNAIRQGTAFEESRAYVQNTIASSTDPHVIIFDRYCPWQEVVINETDALYVIFPATGSDWRIRAVPDRMGSFAVRRPLPKHWGGLRREELVAVTGVEDAIFCHQALFIAGATSREGAIRLCEIALR